MFFRNLKKIILGRDTRISGYMLQSSFQSGLFLSGVSVISAGIIPTPAISYFTRLFNLEVGVIISASHNQFMDNGIKFFIKDGIKLSIQLEKKIEQELSRKKFQKKSLYLSYISHVNNLKQQYINFCKSTLPHNFSLRKIKIVLDCANGSTFIVAPKIFRDLDANVIPIFISPNGYNINKKCGAVDVRVLQKAVLLEKADLGIAFDGDGDRVIMIDHVGNKVNGDQILYILAKYYHENERLKGGVVSTHMSNGGLFLALKKIGIPLITVNVGDRCVIEKLQEKKWVLGAESSGHIVLLDYLPVCDGIIASLQILKIILNKNSSLQRLCIDVKLLPQIIINITEYKDINFLKNFKIQSVLSTHQDFLGKYSRVILRLSGTEKCIRIMVEGDCFVKVNKFSKILINAISLVSQVQFSVITIF